MSSARPPQPGSEAPGFTALTDEGKEIRLSDFRGKRVILFFYPRDMTSGCTAQACGFRDAHPEITAANAVVLGVSPDGTQSHAEFRAKHGLPFTLLVDADHRIAEAYGVWGEKTMYGRKFMGVIRSHFVIGEDGTILDARVRVSPADSVQAAVAAVTSTD